MSIEGIEVYLARYNAIMNEVHDRLDIIDATMKELFAPHGPLNVEICFLQLRKICELIALGCLSAHGDLGKGVKSSVLKEWDVNKIMKALEVLNADFYPNPTKIDIVNGEIKVSDPETKPILDKKRLLRLYGRSGEFLHRGSLKKLFEGKITDVTTEIVDNASRIVALLQEHRIYLIGLDRQLFCRMAVAPVGRAESFITSSPADRR